MVESISPLKKFAGPWLKGKCLNTVCQEKAGPTVHLNPGRTTMTLFKTCLKRHYYLRQDISFACQTINLKFPPDIRQVLLISCSKFLRLATKCFKIWKMKLRKVFCYTRYNRLHHADSTFSLVLLSSMVLQM